ncbi:hypothetical protein OEC11_004378 [Salmonella enterica]|nr:hypothetical protein [Salmonella enterica]EBB7160005.1 hypothetical protein [Salmonella enterica]EBU3194717.1 hypothetical protein [Salmonella enterica]EFV3501231.1 hypothetical protein [Salmonella enterica]EGP5865278.1 hypothetical protein [Salmonella enterica]
MKVTDPKLVELITGLLKWHKRAVAGCDLMRENADKTFSIEGMEDFTLSEAEQKGFRIGVTLACTQFQFPLQEVISLGSDVADDGAEGD